VWVEVVVENVEGDIAALQLNRKELVPIALQGQHKEKKGQDRILVVSTVEKAVAEIGDVVVIGIEVVVATVHMKSKVEY
jgi:hypothetical protein